MCVWLGVRGWELRAPSVGVWHGVGVPSRCVLGHAENTGTRVRDGLMHTYLFPGGSLFFCVFLGRTQSPSPGACPWVAMWGLTASLTSWSASRSLRASASTSSVWVSGLASGRRRRRLLGDCSVPATCLAGLRGSQAEGDLWFRLWSCLCQGESQDLTQMPQRGNKWAHENAV